MWLENKDYSRKTFRKEIEHNYELQLEIRDASGGNVSESSRSLRLVDAKLQVKISDYSRKTLHTQVLLITSCSVLPIVIRYFDVDVFWFLKRFLMFYQL